MLRRLGVELTPRAPLVSQRGRTALRFARVGLRVFPVFEANDDGSCSCGDSGCKRVAKHPRTHHGVKDASCDEATISEWWSASPNANIGVATGMLRSGRSLVVVDCDCRDGGDGTESLARFAAAHGNEVPETLTVRTPRGQHLWFLSDRRFPLRVGMFEGVDVRAEDGYVLVPGSSTAHGTYEWGKEIKPRPLPGWLADAIASKPRALARRTRGAGARAPSRSRKDWGPPLGVLADWDERDDVKYALQKKLGIGESFTPWWRLSESGQEGARFWRDEAGVWVVRDFGADKHDKLRSLSLTELYAAEITGAARRLRGDQAAWKIRMLAELGLVDLVPIALPESPPGMSPFAVALYAEMVELLLCRWTAEPDVPIIASAHFLKHWARSKQVRGASVNAILAARKEIICCGLFIQVGGEVLQMGLRPTPLLMPGPVDASPSMASSSEPQ
jgi:hypothetical protein